MSVLITLQHMCSSFICACYVFSFFFCIC